MLNNDEYQRWRFQKIEQYLSVTSRVEDNLIEIGDLQKVTAVERAELLERVKHFNMAFYACPVEYDPDDAQYLIDFARSFGVHRQDTVHIAKNCIIKTTNEKYAAPPLQHYDIPWHTDGYYNSLDKQVYSAFLHWVQPAQEGGENRFIDSNMLYIFLRDHHREYLDEFFRDDAATVVSGNSIWTGPVITEIHPGEYHFRYSELPFFQWRQDSKTMKVAREIAQHLQDSPYVFSGKMQAGWGAVTNNVPHYRAPYDSNSTRILHRARFYDRIPNT